MDDLLTTGEVARLLGKAPRTIRGYIAAGRLPVARRVNPRLVLVRRGDVERLRVSSPPPPSPPPTA